MVFEEAARDSIAPGRSTEAAVYNGLLLSQAGAVSLAVREFGGGDSRLYFSGGDGAQLRDTLGQQGVFVADLVLDGLAILGEIEGAAGS